MNEYLITPVNFAGQNDDVGAAAEDIDVAGGGDLDSPPTILVRHYSTLQMEVQNTGAALTDFFMLGKSHSGGQWRTMLSGADWNTLGNILIHRRTTAGNLSTLGSGAAASIKVDIRGLYAVKFQASCGTATDVLIGGQLAAS